MKKALLVLALSIVMTFAGASVAFADDQIPEPPSPTTTDQTPTSDEPAGGSTDGTSGSSAGDKGGSIPSGSDTDSTSGDGTSGSAGGEGQDTETTDKPAEGTEPETPPEPISLATATVAITDQNYTGATLEPAVTVTLGTETLVRDTDFTVSYADNKEVGDATVTVTGIGKYEGTASGTFAIGHAAGLAAFTDLKEGEWYLSADKGALPNTKTLFLDVVVTRGIMLGYEDSIGARTKFGPDDPVSRGQVVAMLYRLSHPDANDTTDATAIAAAKNGTQLPDVASGKFFTAAVNWAVEAGIVSGYRDAVERYYSFGADDPITREQLATMVGRFCVGYLGLAMETASLDTFTDSSSMSAFAKPGIQYCVANSIMGGYSGTHLFGPGDQATRSQMAKVMAMVISLTNADENIAANGWPTECTWHGGDSFPAPAPSNWVYEGGSWYYKNADGTNKTGFLEINGNKVHFADDGKMTTGWFKPGDGTTYLFADNGIAVKGWVFTGGRWHYFDEKTSAFVKKSLTNDLDLDAYIEGIANANGRDLGRCFDWMWNMGHVQSLDGRTHWGIVSDEISLQYVRMARAAGACDCYGDASLFCWLARACGYAANFRAGGCPSASAGTVPHGWTEVYINGATYVCDANLRRDIPGANWYMVTYDSAPLGYTL